MAAPLVQQQRCIIPLVLISQHIISHQVRLRVEESVGYHWHHCRPSSIWSTLNAGIGLRAQLMHVVLLVQVYVEILV
jgi:hypothetical protein